MAIGCLTLWFFLWLGLMRHWDLSKLYPFEGLNPAMMALPPGSCSKKNFPARAWVGLLIVSAGIALVGETETNHAAQPHGCETTLEGL